MAQQAWRKRFSWRHGVQIGIALLLPVVLCAGVALLEARRVVGQESHTAALVLLRQAETISRHAWATVDRLRGLGDQPCAEIQGELRRTGSLMPYFRSLWLARDQDVYCSSVSSAISQPLAGLIREDPPVAQERWTASIPGTSGVEERPAVVYADETGLWGVYAVVDGQYLLDLMGAVSGMHAYSLGMRFGTGSTFRNGPVPGDAVSMLPGMNRTLRSDAFPIQVDVAAGDIEVLQAWRTAFLAFLPMALFMSAVLGLAVRYVQKRRLSYAEELRKAIARDEFEVHYQPVYGVAAGCCQGVEALLRWRKPDGSWVRPDVFIAAAEAEGMIVPLTRHLFALVARDVVQWPVQPGFHVGVNIAPEHLALAGLMDDVEALARQTAERAPAIVLEITERSVVADDPQVLDNLTRLRGQGVRVAIDDFGTGNCSLSYLQRFPVDYLKVDRGFITGIESVDGEAPILDAIIALSHKLGLAVVAEGVETGTQLDYLRRKGVAYIQGYLYARPMPGAQLAAWLRAGQGRPPGAQPAADGGGGIAGMLAPSSVQ